MKESKIWNVIFVTYVFLLIFFVVVKFNGSIDDRINSIKENRNLGVWNYNLIPFRSITPYLRNISDSYAYTNILGNIVSFVPLGFLIPIIFKKYRTLLETILICIMSIIGIEIFQFIAMVGYLDIDDILLNMFGCLLGYFVYVGFRKLFSKKKLPFPNIYDT